MTTSMLRDLLRLPPFRPCRVVMSGGESYEVRHPEMAWVAKHDLFVGIDATADGVPADARTCPLFHVAPIEPLVPDARAGRRSVPLTATAACGDAVAL